MNRETMYVKLKNGTGYDTIYKDRFNAELHEIIEDGVIVDAKQDEVKEEQTNPEKTDGENSEKPTPKTRKSKKSDAGNDEGGSAIGE